MPENVSEKIRVALCLEDPHHIYHGENVNPQAYESEVNEIVEKMSLLKAAGQLTDAAADTIVMDALKSRAIVGRHHINSLIAHIKSFFDNEIRP